MTQTPPFEEALTELERIVTQLESSKLPLETSLQLFEKGITLSKLCATKLSEAEKNVDALLKQLESAQGPASGEPA